MAFPTGWGRKCPVVIQSSQVSASLTDFPLLLTEDTLPSEMFDADGTYPALNGGGDIRFSSDSAGATQLACEIVSFVTDNNPANGTAEIWVKVPSVSSSADTTIYVWYNKAGESQPAASDTYGSQNVWNNYTFVQHMTGIDDSSATAASGTNSGSTAVTGKIGGARSFVNSSNQDIEYADGSYIDFGTGDFSFSTWVYLDNVAAGIRGLFDTRVDSNNRIGVYQSGTKFTFQAITGGTTRVAIAQTSNLSDSTWYYLVWVSDRDSAANTKIYLNAVNDTNGTPTQNATDISISADFSLGKLHTLTSNSLDGDIDEFRITKSVLTADWISAEYNNQNSPSTFVVEGTPETPGGGPTFLAQIIMS